MGRSRMALSLRSGLQNLSTVHPCKVTRQQIPKEEYQLLKMSRKMASRQAERSLNSSSFAAAIGLRGENARDELLLTIGNCLYYQQAHSQIATSTVCQRGEAKSSSKVDIVDNVPLVSEPARESSLDLKDLDGRKWGIKHESRALATYASNFIPLTCSGATAVQCRKPILLANDYGDKLYVKPDATLVGAELLYPGGVVIEVKCPYGDGDPKPQPKVVPNHMLQLQSSMAATFCHSCHVVYWTPRGTNIFLVPRNDSYIKLMLHALSLFLRMTDIVKQGVPTEETNAQQYLLDRAWLKDEEFCKVLKSHHHLRKKLQHLSTSLAKKSEAIARIPLTEYVSLSQPES